MYPNTSPAVLAAWPRQALSLLRRYLAPHRGHATALALLILAGAGLELVGPQILQRAIDATNAGVSAGYLGRLGLLFMLATLVTRATQGATAYVTADISWRATNRLRDDLARHALALPMHFHGEMTPGQLAERIDGDAGALADFLSRFVLQLLANALLLFGAIAVLFAKDWRIGSTFLVALAATLVTYGKLGSVAVGAAQAERQAQSDLMGVMEENLSGAEDARPLGAGPYLIERLLRASRRQVLASGRAWALSAVPLAATMLVLALNHIVSLVLSVRLVETGALTIGAIYLIVQYSDLIGRPLRDLARQMGVLQQAGASVLRVTDLLGREPEGAANAGTEARLPAGPLGVRFADVTLSYPGGPPVLKGVSFTLGPRPHLGGGGAHWRWQVHPGAAALTSLRADGGRRAARQ